MFWRVPVLQVQFHIDTISYLTLEGPCIIFCNIYIHSNEIHTVAALIVN